MLLKLIDPKTSTTEEFKCVSKACVQKPSYRIIMIVEILKQPKCFQIRVWLNCGRSWNRILWRYLNNASKTMEKRQGVESDRSKSSIKTNVYRSTVWNITSIKMCVGKILTGNIPHNACFRCLSLVFFFYLSSFSFNFKN